MKIGVLSDTHWHRGEFFDKRIFNLFRDVEAIFHAGDLISLDILNILEKFRPTYAVSGNCDYNDVKSRLPRKRVFKANGARVGIIHGWRKDLAYLPQLHRELGDVDIVIFGHTHIVTNLLIDGVLFFNPGSPTFPREGGCSVGIIDFANGPIATHYEL